MQGEFAKNVFPYMRVTWKAYPDNIGHFYFPGCFRCHNGSHRNEKQETISADCNLCHDVVVQGVAGKGMEAARIGESLAFRHPEEIGDAWQQMPCTDCHTGGHP